jgi:hypothetical protein
VLLALQRTHGNRYVQRVVAGIQAKLKISQPGDVYEQEADRVAEQVMSMPVPADMSLNFLRQDVVKKEEGLIMAKEVSVNALEVSDDLHTRLNQSRSGGQPLPEKTRTFMESKFGVDFSAVRLHTDSQAVQMARELNAEAFTFGRDIYFGAERYSPGTSAGERLLAHELTHVVQQGEKIPNLADKKDFGNISISGMLAPTIQRRVGGDIAQMSITEQFAHDLTDEELEQQIQIVREQLTTLNSSTPEFEVARSNLQTPDQEQRRREIPTVAEKEKEEDCGEFDDASVLLTIKGKSLTPEKFKKSIGKYWEIRFLQKGECCFYLGFRAKSGELEKKFAKGRVGIRVVPLRGDVKMIWNRCTNDFKVDSPQISSEFKVLIDWWKLLTELPEEFIPGPGLETSLNVIAGGSFMRPKDESNNWFRGEFFTTVRADLIKFNFKVFSITIRAKLLSCEFGHFEIGNKNSFELDFDKCMWKLVKSLSVGIKREKTKKPFELRFELPYIPPEWIRLGG